LRVTAAERSCRAVEGHCASDTGAVTQQDVIVDDDGLLRAFESLRSAGFAIEIL
jgi:hypothetical protein